MDGIATQVGMMAGGGGELVGDHIIIPDVSGDVRNDFTGTVGYQFEVLADCTIHSLARWVLAGNSSVRNVKLWSDAGALLASTSVNLSNFSSGDWAEAAISPITLNGGELYRISSYETINQDEWYDLAVPLSEDNIDVIKAYYSLTDSFPNIVSSTFRVYVPTSARFVLL